MNPILVWAGAVLCALIIIACICRVNLLTAGVHRFAWGVLYIAYAAFAMGCAIDLLIQRFAEWWVCLGVAGVVLQLWLTRKDWRAGAPQDIRRVRS